VNGPWRSKLVIVLGLFVLAVVGSLAVLKVNSLYWPQHQGEKMARQIAFVTSIQGLSVFGRACLDLIVGTIMRPAAWFQHEMYLNYRHDFLTEISLGVAIVLDLMCLGPGLVSGAWKKKGMAVLTLATVVVTAVFLGYATCLVLYLVDAEPEASKIPGFQIRYLFPAVMVGLFLPLVLLEDPPANYKARPRAFVPSLAQGLALGFLPFLMLARQVELVTDLLIRYW
jgi:hypothetical protein